MTAAYIAEELSAKLIADAPDLAKLDAYMAGKQPAAFLSRASLEALGGRFRTLSVNFPRLVVSAHAERLQVTGFRLGTPDAPADADLWRIWRRNDMVEGSAQAHTEALALGRAYAIVWASDDATTPRVSVESAHQVAVSRSPLTREIVSAIKRWDEGGYAHCVVYEADKITQLRSRSKVTPDNLNVLAADAWESVKVTPNPLGVVPVVQLVNRGRLLDLDGVSEISDVADLADAINKVTADMLVTSEYYARPRRWATGIEVEEDEDGNVINPFSSEAGRMWQSEASETKFGQFDAARLDGYGDALATLTQQIGALSGLPPHYLGLHGDQPASADAIRSAEAAIVATAHARQRSFGAAWADVVRLIIAVRDGVDSRSVEVETVWADAETRTPAQAADAAAKLASIGVPLTSLLEGTLGYSPAQVERVRELRRSEALDTAGVDLTAVLP